MEHYKTLKILWHIFILATYSFSYYILHTCTPNVIEQIYAYHFSILYGMYIYEKLIYKSNIAFHRNAEDVRREDNELQSASHHVLTLDGEVLSVNGKLLAGHVLLDTNDQADQVSVCSCTCLGPARCHNQLLQLEPVYQPSGNSLKVKRASV